MEFLGKYRRHTLEVKTIAENTEQIVKNKEDNQKQRGLSVLSTFFVMSYSNNDRQPVVGCVEPMLKQELLTANVNSLSGSTVTSSPETEPYTQRQYRDNSTGD